MHLSDLSQLANYDHIYLSPHLDDVALSCGGAIVNQRERGERVLVVTLCTAAPAPEGPFNALAQEFHRFWALSAEQVVAARLKEDMNAMKQLDVDFLWAGFLDAIYRCPNLYTTRNSLFGTPAPADPLLPELTRFIADMRQRVPNATVYAPLGVGFHVDHQITHRATRATGEAGVVFYEDFPYAAHAGAVQARLDAVQQPLMAHATLIASALPQKIAAIAAYASQLDELFRTAPMAETVRSYHAEIGNGSGAAERTWAVN